MKINGVVEDIIYHNISNGYTVLNIDKDGILVTCVGKTASLNEGEYIELDGEYVKNGKYGEQFAFTEVKISAPNSLEGIKRYLASGLIKGIGPVTAEAIVNKFKHDTLSIIEFNPNRLAEVKGVSINKAISIGESYNEIKNMQRAVMFLQEYNITTNMAVKIYNTYLDKTVDIVSSNPYKLIEDVDGIGFATADKIAANMGIANDSEFRVRAGILHVLKDSCEKGGNTYLPRSELFENVQRLLSINDNFDVLFDGAIQSLVLDSVIKCFDHKEYMPVVMLSRFYSMEQSIAKKIAMINLTEDEQSSDVDQEIAEYERLNHITLHPDQKEAVKTAVNKRICVITGGPGTGKTTIVKCILKVLGQYNSRIYLLAPTGRAAKRLSQSCDKQASTIHRALEVNFKDDEKNFFNYNERNKLPADVVIIDEVSMVDVPLMYYLLKALSNNCKIILVGDKDQLPSVGPGNVLHDILKSGVVPTVMLTQIYRQDENSLIVSNAHLINQGKMPVINNKSKDFFYEERHDGLDILNTVVDLVTDRLPKFTKLDPVNIQVLAPMKSGVTGVNRLNKELQERINPPSLRKNEINLEFNTFREGDKVMQTCNNYDREWVKETDGVYEEGKGVFNGDMGFITRIDFQTGETTVVFDDDRRAVYPRNEISELQICYATTIHKSQGSEFDVIVMPLMAGSSQIITRNLLYTAVTRAKSVVVLVGERKHISRMIYNNYIASRYSMLSDFIVKNKKTADILYK